MPVSVQLIGEIIAWVSGILAIFQAVASAYRTLRRRVRRSAPVVLAPALPVMASRQAATAPTAVAADGGPNRVSVDPPQPADALTPGVSTKIKLSGRVAAARSMLRLVAALQGVAVGF